MYTTYIYVYTHKEKRQRIWISSKHVFTNDDHIFEIKYKI